MPAARGTILTSFRTATVEVLGESALREVGTLLPDEVRASTVEVAPLNIDWFPESYVLAWYEALWSGPCAYSKDLFFKLIDHMLDLGFGRIQRAALAIAKPAMIVRRAPALWRHDHSHGELGVEATNDSAVLTLSHHPYTEDALSCMATAEIYRYCLSLGRVESVTARHFRESDGTLTVKLHWVS